MMRDVFAAIRAEREYQDGKYGSISERYLSLGDWLVIMQAELHEAMEAFVKGRSPVPCLAEILQVVSVGVAALQQHGVIERSEVEEEKNAVPDGV